MTLRRRPKTSALHWTVLAVVAVGAAVVVKSCDRWSGWETRMAEHASEGLCLGVGAILFLAGACGLLMVLAKLVSLPGEHRNAVRLRRLRSGRCPYCGYDVRATPGRCPECGWAVRSPPQPEMYADALHEAIDDRADEAEPLGDR